MFCLHIQTERREFFMDKLKALFDFHRFSPNEKMDNLIEKTKRKYFCGTKIADDDLDVSAAGDHIFPNIKNQESDKF